MHKDNTAGMFRAACERLHITQSMGRPGSAPDNAVIESWHSTLEVELRRVEHFATRTDARRGVAAWIDDYNRDRRSLGVDELLRVVASDGRPMGQRRADRGARACGARGHLRPGSRRPGAAAV